MRKQSQVILLHKPFNTLCQFTGEAADSTLADYVDIAEVYPAGRLDKDSEGLLLLTNDGPLQNQIANPKHKLEKSYWVQVEGSPTDKDLEPLRQGLNIQDYRTLPAKAQLIEQPDVEPRNPPIRERKNIATSWLEIKIKQGKNRQVRRMTAAIGFPTLRLIRAKIGNLSLEGIPCGEYRVLNDEEIKHIKKSFSSKINQLGSKNKAQSKRRQRFRSQTK